MPTSRQTLYQFGLHFFLVNIFLSLLISFNYIHILPHYLALAGNTFQGILLWVFFGISFFAQMTILFLIGFLFIIIFALLFPYRFVISILSVIFTTLLILSLIIDAIVFHLFHMHYAAVGWEIFKANALFQVLTISPSEGFILIGAVLIVLSGESILAWKTWQHVAKKYSCRWSKCIALFSICCVVISYSVNLTARESPEKYGINNSYLIVKTTRFIPYYDDIFQLVTPTKTVRRIQTASSYIDLQLTESRKLFIYPKHPLQFQKSSSPPLNIVVIVIDTWRYDAMNQNVTPNIYQFAKQSLQFTNHWSGGNATQAGLFSFFYGMPANYWNAALQQKRGPEFIHQLIKENYQINIFASAALNFPAFDQTIFQEIKPLHIHTTGYTTLDRDQKITQEFKQSLLHRNIKQPFFSFLFYDAVHNYCDKKTPKQHPFNPWIADCNRFFLAKKIDRSPYLNRYLNAVHFVDHEVKQVLDILEQQHLLKNTIIILTADHGEEINDHHSGYWQHASAYTPYQLHIPLLIYWPGQKPKIYTHYTTHYDFVPTVMTRVLHCKNQLKDYTLGQSLFTVGHRPLLISGSYADYAIITKDFVTRVYNAGDYAIENYNGKPTNKYTLQVDLMQQAFDDLNTYFNK